MTVDTSPAGRLKLIRTMRNYASATAFARAVGVPEASYRAHENGFRRPTEATARRYAQALGVSWAWLITGEGSMRERDSTVQDEAAAILALDIEGTAEPDPALEVFSTQWLDHPVMDLLIRREAIDRIARPAAVQAASRAFALRIDGDALAPRLVRGDTAVFDPMFPACPAADGILLAEHGAACWHGRLVHFIAVEADHWVTTRFDHAVPRTEPRAAWSALAVVRTIVPR